VRDTWWTRRIIADISRTWRGPCRAPGRLVVPPSHGTPMIPMSMSCAASIATCGRRMNVTGPAYLGMSIPEIG
jgi:hypothetical protein